MAKCNMHVVQGVLSIIGAFFIHFTFGHFYTIANMAPYIMGYAKLHTDPGLKESNAIWLSAVALGLQGITMPMGGFVAKKLGYRFVLVTSCLLMSSGVFLTFFTIQKSFIGVVLTYAMLKGGGFSFGYSVALAVASSWFPARRGLIMGLIVGGFGLGALVFTPIQTAFINPENIKVDNVTRQFTDKKLLNRVPPTFLLLGTILLSFQIIGLFLVREYRAPISQENDETKESSVAKSTGSPTSQTKQPNTPQLPVQSTSGQQKPKDESLSPKHVLRCLDFYLLWIVMFCDVIPLTVITSTYKYFGQTYISNDRFLSAVAMTSAIFNFGGRVMWGSIVDKMSFKVPLCSLLAIWATLLITFPHLSYASGIVLQIFYAIWVCLLFTCLSGMFGIMPAATGRLFGGTYLAINYGMLFTAFSIGSLLSAGVTSLIASKRAYVFQYTASAVICLIALFATLWLEDPKMSPKFRIFNVFVTNCRKRRTKQSEQPQN